MCFYFAHHQTTDSNSSSKEHAYPQLTTSTKLQPCRPEPVAGSTMRVWQVRAVLRVCLIAFIGACNRSPDHTTTSLPLLLAVRDRIIRALYSPEPIPL